MCCIDNVLTLLPHTPVPERLFHDSPVLQAAMEEPGLVVRLPVQRAAVELWLSEQTFGTGPEALKKELQCMLVRACNLL